MESLFAFVFLLSVVAASEVSLLGGNQCKAVERSSNVLGIDAVDSLLLSIDLDLGGFKEMLDGYATANDLVGQQCLVQLESRLNASINDFRVKINGFEKEEALLKLYLEVALRI